MLLVTRLDKPKALKRDTPNSPPTTHFKMMMDWLILNTLFPA